MNEPPDHTAELRDDRPEVGAHELLVLAQAGVHVEEDHALGLEVGLELVVDDLGLVLRADAGQELALGLGDAEPVPGLLDVRREVLPGLRLLLGRPDVVVDVLEVDAGEVAAPKRHRACLEVLERLQAEVAHPLRLVLVLGDRRDDLARKPPLGLEEVVLGIAEAVAVLVADLRDDLCLGGGHQATASSLAPKTS
jgi:hypothetical protein